MGSHFHLRLGVPSKRESLEGTSDRAFLDRLTHICDADEVEPGAIDLDPFLPRIRR
jgi:hypothetical protein